MKQFKRYSGVIVKCQDKVLLCKRAPYKSYPNMWSIPGGKIEKGEDTKEAAIREFLEETNIDLSSKDLEFVGVTSLPHKTDDNVKKMMYVYVFETDKELIPDFDSARDGFEHTDWGYFTKNQLDEFKIGKRLTKLLKFIL